MVRRVMLVGIVLFGACVYVNARADGSGGIDLNLEQFEQGRVLAAADQALKDQPVTITAYPATRSTGGIHDYYSEADYDWPNPKDPSGPYINRDGMSNPTNFNAHRMVMRRLSIDVPALTAAYLITGDKRYADHAIDFLMAWFVTPTTRMNPNLEHSQAIRQSGINGRSIGIIDTLHLVEVAQAVVVLRAHGALTKEEDEGITQWFAEYVDWMTTSDMGHTEGAAKNNHATCYWEQVAEFAKVTGNDKLLDECREKYKDQLLEQMAPDGSFPRELKRTKPYGYSLFNLDQMVTLCQMLSTPSDDLWAYTLPGGQNIHKGLEFMYPYVKDKAAWEKRPGFKPDVLFYDQWPVRTCTWLFAGLHYDDPKYIELWESLKPNVTNDEVTRNVPLRQPLLWVR